MACPSSVAELLDILTDKDGASHDSLTLVARPDWALSRNNLVRILKAARRNTSIQVLRVSISASLTANQAEAMAEILSCFDCLRKLELYGSVGSQVVPKVMDCLLLGVSRSKSQSLAHVTLDQDGGPDAIIDFLERFATIETLSLRNLSSETYAHGLAMGLSHLKGLKSLKLANVRSAMACLQLFTPLAQLPLKKLEVYTTMNIPGTISVVKSLKVLCQCTKSIRICTFDSAGGASGTDARHLFGNSRLASSMEELNLFEMILPSAESIVLPKPNDTLKKLRIGETLFHPNSLAILHGFRRLMSLELYGCAGDGLEEVSGWITLLQKLEYLTALKLDISHFSHDAASAIALGIRQHASLKTLHLELGDCPKSFPALQELVGSCRETLSVNAYNWCASNLSYLRLGLKQNFDIKNIYLYFDECQHTNEEYLSLLKVVSSATGIKSFQLGGDPIELKDECGSEVATLLNTNQLISFSMLDFSLSLGFVRNISRGLSNGASSLSSLDIGSCRLEGGGLYLLAASLELSRCRLETLSVNIDGSSLDEQYLFFEALAELTHLTTLCVFPEVQSLDTAQLVVGAVRQCVSLQTVQINLSPRFRAERCLIDFYLKVNGMSRPFNLFLAEPGQVPQGLWPSIYARLVALQPTSERTHLLYHFLLRRNLPSLVNQK